MHPALNTTTVHILCTLLSFSILTGLFANKGQKALRVYNKNVCVLLRMICLDASHCPEGHGWKSNDRVQSLLTFN